MLYALDCHLAPIFCASHNSQCKKSAILTVRSGEKISPGYNLCAVGQKPLKLSFYTVHQSTLLSFLFFALCLYRQEKTKIQDTFFKKILKFFRGLKKEEESYTLKLTGGSSLAYALCRRY